MRPHSEIRIILNAALVDGGGTTRQLAQRTNGGISQTREALNNMVRAGDAKKARYIRVKGVCRPVPWYERATRAADETANDEPMQDLIAAWAMRPLSRPVNSCEAAM